ncbi:copper amine oxidase-like protein [Moorella sp. E308F]|uniref:copper amine oxidase N-terminal domain-containing protein n=1 Tax=Moorella sp. E308F TaxID=2572682 RepID=UPI0010FFB544|nr:copper amine oxidase N-terminal domain-containing protein [Moorella sp. E308F]GEA14280.1 copper amine oxidase-like protein [Moorella sp. E308F]
MLKTRKKWISILLTLAMLVGLMVPFAGTAIAGTTYEALDAPSVKDDAVRDLGTLRINVDPTVPGKTSEALISLPDDFDIVYEEGTDVQNFADFAAGISAYLEDDGVTNVTNAVYLTEVDENSFKLSYTPSGSGELNIYIPFENIYVADGAPKGDIEVTIDGISGQFGDGKVVIGKVSGSAVEVSVVEDDTFSDEGGTVTIRVEEDVAGSLNEEDTLDLVLPDGFEWSKPSNKNVLWGSLNASDLNIVVDPDDKDELHISLQSEASKSTSRSAFEFTVDIEVAETDDAEYGDVVVDVKGDYSATPDEIIVGTYGDYDVTIEADDPDVIAYAGYNEQDVSDITIKETVAGSLINGRSITLTLPANARWVKIDDKEIDPDNGVTNVAEDGDVRLDAKLQGTDDRTLKLTVDGSSEGDDAVELTIEDIQVALKAGVTGDLVVEVGGSAGLEGEITIAKVVAPISVSADKTNIEIGKYGQAAGDIVITEYAAEAIKADDLVVTLPDDVDFDGTPDVEVTEGDLEIEDIDVDDNVLTITIGDESTEASTIVISDIKYAVNRVLPEGDIEVEIGGDAVVETDKVGYESDDPFFEDDDVAAVVVNATCVTAAGGATKQSASFVIGSTTYSVNGVEATMDVAAYVKNGRTYLPVRYVAYALGISPENILWDGKTATFIGNGRVVQATPGSAILSINGAPVTMDVVTEVVNGRVMVPFRWIAQAFGAQVDYNETTQTVNMSL